MDLPIRHIVGEYSQICRFAYYAKGLVYVNLPKERIIKQPLIPSITIGNNTKVSNLGMNTPSPSTHFSKISNLKQQGKILFFFILMLL
jgi:hypothetical protein